ncbi:TetR family transcriptional regulator [Myxococcus sp. 1LA]
MVNVISMVPRQRAAILAAGREVFARRGYSAASMQDIARQARLSLEWVQLHFQRKRDLFGAVVEQVWGVAFARLEDAVRCAPGPEEKLQAYIEVRQQLAEQVLRGLPLTPESLRDLVPRVEPWLAASKEREVALLESIFDEGRAQGVFGLSERGPRTAARALMVGLQDIERAMVQFLLASARAVHPTEPSTY